jgi:hypothetical protein
MEIEPSLPNRSGYADRIPSNSQRFLELQMRREGRRTSENKIRDQEINEVTDSNPINMNRIPSQVQEEQLHENSETFL